MAKKYVAAAMLAIALLGGLYAIISFNGKNESIRFDKSYTWHADHDAPSGTDLLIRGTKIDRIKKNVNQLIAAFNSADKRETLSAGEVAADFPSLKLVKIEEQAAVVEVVNSEYLTQKMGTTGAEDYLASATYTITENPAVHEVNFVFTEGDHAVPGVYTRDSFSSKYKIETGKI